MWPTWGRPDPGGPHVGLMNFAICGAYTHRNLYLTYISIHSFTVRGADHFPVFLHTPGNTLVQHTNKRIPIFALYLGICYIRIFIEARKLLYPRNILICVTAMHAILTHVSSDVNP